MTENTKYRVKYYESESERGWGSDSWTTDYATQKEAEDMVEKTNKLCCSEASAPDYYKTATYIGEVKV